MDALYLIKKLKTLNEIGLSARLVLKFVLNLVNPYFFPLIFHFFLPLNSMFWIDQVEIVTLLSTSLSQITIRFKIIYSFWYI